MVPVTTIGLINPGAMGASVGAAAAFNHHHIIWASDGRSQETRSRAERAGLQERSSLAELVAESDVILSICPPDQAINVAHEISDLGYKGLYVEANAISPASCRAIHAILPDAAVVDGGIIGGPAWKKSSGTRLYLSGQGAAKIAGLFDQSPLEAIVVSDKIGAASALKMCFAAYTKGTSALLGAILALAEQEGVRSDLQGQWGEDFSNQASARVRASSAKAWRFIGEMREIAATFASAGLPAEFHEAAATIYERQHQFKNADPLPDLEQILAALVENKE